MILELTSVIFCLWLIKKIYPKLDSDENKIELWSPARQSLRWGITIVTVLLFGFFGIIRYVHGQGFPNIFTIILCTAITAIVFIGVSYEITGNVLVDSLILSIGLVCFTFTVINGIPEALARISGENLCRWMLLCVGAAIIVRAFTWASKGK